MLFDWLTCFSTEIVSLDSYDSEGPHTPETDDSAEVKNTQTQTDLCLHVFTHKMHTAAHSYHLIKETMTFEHLIETAFVLIWIINLKCVTREKGEPLSHRVKKIFRASNWSAMERMGKQWIKTSSTPPNQIKSNEAIMYCLCNLNMLWKTVKWGRELREKALQ